MIDFIKNSLLTLIALLFFSFYVSFAFTVGIQVCAAHKLLFANHTPQIINLGIITFVICGFVPIFLWKIIEGSQMPILKETLGARLILSQLAIAFTICLFISKSIYNSIAKPIVSLENDVLLDINGRIVLVEILSLAIPGLVFLYISKKVIHYYLKKFKE